MSIAQGSVLNGHVFGNLIQAILGLVVVVGATLAVGFRPTAGPVERAATVSLLVLVGFALTWLSVAFGLVAKTVEGASNLPMPLIPLPFLGSGFVPTEGMPTAMRWFAEYQPFTPTLACSHSTWCSRCVPGSPPRPCTSARVALGSHFAGARLADPCGANWVRCDCTRLECNHPA